MSHGDSLLHPITSIITPLRMKELFSEARPAELEIGCGDGGFLLGYARDHSGRNFAGVERLLGRIRKLDKQARREGLKNLRLLRFEARYLIRHLLPADAFEAIHIYFPDPWPKDRHARHRLVDDDFPAMAARLLTACGVIHLRTDNEPYFKQMQAAFEADGGFAAEETPADLATRKTEFETSFNAQGIPTLRASWRLA